MRTSLFVSVALAAALAGTSASAQEIAPTGYSAPGWAGNYPDSSGGELTDGTIADRHYAYYSPHGAPYVGWDGTDPEITFTFAGIQNFGRLIVWVDNNNNGAGVGMPNGLSAVVGGVTYSSWYAGAPLDTGYDYGAGYIHGTSPGGGTPMILNLAGAVGDTVVVNVANSHQWTFISEVEFFAAPVPEPGTWAMMIGGFGLMGGLMRRRRTSVSFA